MLNRRYSDVRFAGNHIRHAAKLTPNIIIVLVLFAVISYDIPPIICYFSDILFSGRHYKDPTILSLFVYLVIFKRFWSDNYLNNPKILATRICESLYSACHESHARI